jgi:uncharacterized membrane protein
MSTTRTESAPSRTRPRTPTWRVPLALVALSLVPIVAGSLRLTDVSTGSTFMPEDAHHPSIPVALVVHIVSAIVYSLVGAFQFSAGLRRRRPGWHRAAGRVLVPMGLAVAGSALWMTVVYPTEADTGPLLFWSRLLFGVGMVLCLVRGVVAILARDVPTHRAWMIRAYALATGAGTQVVTVGISEAAFGTGDLPKALSMTSGWVINLAVAEWIIRRPARRRRRRARSAQNRAVTVGSP